MKKVYFDSRRCLGCLSCQFACAVEHSKTKDRAVAHLEADKPRTRRDMHVVDGACLSISCRHCDPAPCVDACIIGAMSKDPATGEVTCDSDKCVGCWMCVMVCPFGAVRPGETFGLKCDSCPDRESPACVEACPTRALFVADEKQVKSILDARRKQTHAELSK